jgi:nucleotide-binding universal stress UspA family protein
MSATAALFSVLVIWALIGVLMSMVMGRHGYSAFKWGLLGVVFGPMVIPLAMGQGRLRPQAELLQAGAGSPGPVDVVAGVDGSPEALAALGAAVALLGPRVGRLVLASVIDYESAGVEHGETKEQAAQALEDAARPVAHLDPELEILSGPPATALAWFVREGAFDLLVVGARGRGLSMRLLGSVATHLACQDRFPVLIAGGRCRPDLT